MVDFLVKKGLETQTGIGAMLTPDGSLVEPRRNMAKSMAGFLEKPAILSAMFFDLGINTLSKIATSVKYRHHNPLFWRWGGRQRLYAQLKANPMSSAPPPPPTALPAASMVIAATTTATVIAAGAAVATVTVVDTYNIQESTKSGSGRRGGGGGSDTRTTAATAMTVTAR
jgi:hypothetical protein